MPQKAELTVRCTNCFGEFIAIGIVAETMDGPVEELNIKTCPRCGAPITKVTLDKVPALATITKVTGPVEL